MWLLLLAGLAQAQDATSDQERLLGPSTEVVAQTASSPTGEAAALPETVQTAQPVQPAAQLPVQRPAQPPAEQVMSTPLDSGLIWSLAWPIGLVIAAGATVWWARKKGIKIPGISKGGFKAFATEGPSIQVLTRTTVGTNTLAVLEVSQDGSPSRRLLVSLGPSSSTLLADLDARPGVTVVQQPAATPAAVTWTEPTSAVQAPVPAVVGAPAAIAVAHATPTIAQQTIQSRPIGSVEPQGVQFSDGPTATAQPTHANTPEVAIRFDDQLDQQLADPGPRAPISSRNAEPRSALHERRESWNEPRTSRRPSDDGSALQRRPDWRSATYKSAQAPIDDEFDGLTDQDDERPRRARRSTPQRGRQTPRDLPDERPTRERRAPPKTAGHLSALAGRSPRSDAGRKNGRVPIRQGGNRQERTEAARALLEQVMSRRRAGGDRR